jgi:hypothetical protein
LIPWFFQRILTCRQMRNTKTQLEQMSYERFITMRV